MEEEIFKKCIFIKEKYSKYGFKKEKDSYIYKKEILDGSFEIVLSIKENHLTGKIIEKEFDEEYINFRIENQIGEFVSSIREEYVSLLKDVKEKCTIENNFISKQANRISNHIKEIYKVSPEYLWDDDSNAVFRNNDNKKWFGIVMYINKNKISKENKKVEVMNVKLPPELIEKLLKEKGFYPAYHMQKKYWITFTLDDSIDDKKLEELIDMSYQYTIETKDWVIPANPKYWDIIHCFENVKRIEWKQIDKVAVGDYVYIYVGQPYACLMYQCKVTKKDIRSVYPGIEKCMEIELVKHYKQEEYPFEKLKKYDLRAIRGPRRMPQKLLNILNKS